MSIQSYDVKIEHRPGKTNTFCDFLSRYPGKSVSAVTRTQTAAQQKEDDRLTAEEVRKEQKMLPEYRKLYDAIKYKKLPGERDRARTTPG
ncbi:hypothetical protein AAVH_41632 [Aphelenchoides avenae]|nr:hypothetical protein AAVH_41632 [Aphelenchus avenae]